MKDRTSSLLCKFVCILTCVFFSQLSLSADQKPSAKQTKSNTTTIVTFGDSTTAPRGPLVVYSKILASELPQPGFPVKVINSGIGGNTTSQAMARFEKDVLRHQPDLVVIQYGINDSSVDVWRTPPAKQSRVSKAKYEANLRSLIKQLRNKNIEVILMTPNSMRWNEKMKTLYGKPPYDPDDPDGFNVFLKSYAAIVRTIAKEEKVPLIDVYAAFENYAKAEGHSAHDLLLDGVHPNTAGQKMVADLLIPQIKMILIEKKK